MATQIVEHDPNNTAEFSHPILNQNQLTDTTDEMSDAHKELITTLGTKNRTGGHQHQPSLNVNNSQSQRVSVTGLPPDHLTDAVEKMKLSSIEEEGVKRRSVPHQPSAAAPPAVIPSQSTANRKVQQSTGGSSNAQNSANPISYAAERVIGNGSFGVVYQATVIETGETVAIKKVLQDRRFKNRELQIMSHLSHPCVIGLKHCFYSRGDKPDEVYLNLVMDFVPETVHRTLRNHTKANKLLPNTYLKVYMWQICRAVNYIHSVGVCHRDIKPQNLLQNPKTHETFLCDFGSAKQLVRGEPNVSYICSRYYRAPELVFEATEYTNAIDVWSVGCVMGELMLGQPLFPGESGVDQLIEIIKVLGTPSREEIQAMNPNHTQFKFPQIKPQLWAKVFRNKADPLAIDLISKMLVYDPTKRVDPLGALSHPFFDELKVEGAKMPNGKEMLPKLFEFTEAEVRQLREKTLFDSVVPLHWQNKFAHIQ